MEWNHLRIASELHPASFQRRARARRLPDRRVIFVRNSDQWERDRKRVGEQLARYGFSRIDRMCVSVALDEVVTFAAHWNGDNGRPDAVMVYSVSAREFRARVKLCCSGEGADDRWLLASSCMTGMRVASDGTEVEMWKWREVPADADEPAPRVLLAQRDPVLLELLGAAFREVGYDVVSCSDGRNLVHHLEYYLTPDGDGEEEFDLIVSDARLPGASGLEVFKGLNRAGFPPVVIIAGSDISHEEWESHRNGAAAVFTWPCDVREIISTARRILAVEA